MDRGERAIIDVVNSEGHKEFSPVMENNSPGWNRVIISFYTMKNQTEAKVFVKWLTSGKGNVYVDDCGFILVGEL